MRLKIPPPLLGLAFGVAMWQLDLLLVDWRVALPGRQYVSGALVAVGVIIEVIAVAAFASAKTTVNPLSPHRASTLVVSGLYRYSRNPMYAGMLLLLAGWTVWLGNPVNLLVLAAFVAGITALQIKPEERALRETFGTQFDQYCQRVRRWL